MLFPPFESNGSSTSADLLHLRDNEHSSSPAAAVVESLDTGLLLRLSSE